MKCDETKPKCERCRKATYTCAGYDQPCFNEAPFEREALERKRVRDELYQARHVAFLPVRVAKAQGFLFAERVNQEMNLSAFQENICRSFLYHRLCAGHFSKGISWLLSPAPRVEVQSRTLVSASKAMAAAFFGRVHQQPKIIREGNLFYVEALRNLTSDLSHDVKSIAFETLGATMALNMYELTHLTSTSYGCITHGGGIEKLIHARGPELHKNFPEKEIYGQARMIIVANAIIACRRTFLDEQKWKEVPWEDDRSEKTEFDCLADLLSDLPYLLQEVAHSNSPTATGSPKRLDKQSLQKQVLECLHSLKELQEVWHIKHMTSVWQVPIASASTFGSENLKPPFEEALYFINIFRAYEYCCFQMALILLFLLYQDLSPEDLQPVEDILPGLFHNESIQNQVLNICRCTEYFCLEDNGSRGHVLLQVPATVAYLAVDKDTPGAKWLQFVCKERADSSGFGWGDFSMAQITPLSKWMASCRDRDRNAGSNGGFAGLPMRAGRIIEEEM